MLWYGKAIGAALGAAAGFGVAGALIGGLAGHMVDEIIDGRLVVRRLRRMPWGKEKDKGPLVKALIALSLVMDTLMSPLKNTPPFHSFLINAVSSLFEIPKNKRGVLGPLLEDISRGKNNLFNDAATILIENAEEEVEEAQSKREAGKILLLYVMASDFLGEDREMRKEGLRKLANSLRISPTVPHGNAFEEEFLPLEFLTAYRIFGLNPPIDMRQLKKAYRSLAVQFHPDGAKGLSEPQQRTLEESFKKIQVSYEVLKRELEGTT